MSNPVVFEIGAGLYTCALDVIVFETEKKALEASNWKLGYIPHAACRRGFVYHNNGQTCSNWWSETLKCKTAYIPAGEMICVVKHVLKGKKINLVQVLGGKSVGWITIRSWPTALKKIKKQ